MNASLRKVSVILVVAVLALVLAVPAMADASQPFAGTFDITDADWDNNFIAGTFELTGALQDSGDTNATWFIQGNQRIGTQIFIGDNGTFTIEFRVNYGKPESGCVSGKFKIIEGTGTYVNLAGDGDYIICRPGMGDVVYGSLDGVVK